MKIFDLFKRSGLTGIAAALVLSAGFAPAAQAQTVTISGGSSGCTWTNYSVLPNGNYTFNCGSVTPQPGTIQFSANSYTASIGLTTNVTVTRSGGTSTAIGGNVAVTAGGCTGGGAVNFGDGDGGNKTVTITAPGAAGTCTVTLTPNTGTNTGSPTGATINVVDPTTPGSVGFSAGTVGAQEGGSAVNVNLVRAGGGTQAPAFEVYLTAGGSTAVPGTHYNISGLTAPGTGTCPAVAQAAGNIGCASFALGAASPSTAVTVTALSNAGTTPTLQFVIGGVVQPSTVTVGGTSTVNVNITEGSLPLPANCSMADAHTHLGAGTQAFPLPVTAMAAGNVIALRIPHDLLDGKSVGAFQPTTGMTIAVSNQPCDLGGATLGTVGASSLNGCYWNLPGNNPQQLLLKIRTADGYQTCKKPTPAPDGYLYINMGWQGYTNFGQPLSNFCTNMGFTSCTFQFRRDA